MSERKLSLLKDLEAVGQSHLLAFWEELDSTEQDRLESQLGKWDWEQLSQLAEAKDSSVDWTSLAGQAEPAKAIRSDAGTEEVSRAEAIVEGEQMLREGKVAMILVAGGQGTRLGFDLPKGMFPIGPISNKTLFQLLIEKAIGAASYYGASIPVLIMTSPATHRETIKFLDEHSNFGLKPEDCLVFCQGTMPAFDRETGKLLLAERGQLFESPNGHGGMVEALVAPEQDCLAELEKRGVEVVFYGQIDNPMLQVCDPLTLGYHKVLQSELTTQVVKKTSGLQKVGNVVSVDGVTRIIEYSDLPESAALAEDAQGNLKLWAGNIAVHVFNLDFLRRVANQSDALPYHRAFKKVPFINPQGQRIEPVEPNAIKLEKFIFDLLPLARNALAIEIQPQEGFAAVKNAATAETETAETAKAAMIEHARTWLDRCGVHVEPETEVEICPKFAINEKQLGEKIGDINTVMEPTYFVDNQ